jgi:uncharacterized protein (DUF362 family)
MAESTAVSIVSTADRSEGVGASIDLLDINPAMGKDVLIKPNFNTADPYPGSTHNDTLTALIEKLREMGASSITVGDRSGPVNTEQVLSEKGIYPLCERLRVRLINFETMPEEQWEHFQPEGSHWRKGFYFAKPVLEAGCVVSTCCLKTHGFGGGVTISLKNSIGIVHKKNMTELHTSFRSMKKMIAEANVPYSPGLIVLDAIEAFVDKGPMNGPVKRAGLFIAGTDRVAVDAVGISVLKMLGSNRHVMGAPVFNQGQIERAVELGLGVSGPEGIELLPAGDEESRTAAGRIRAVLDKEA